MPDIDFRALNFFIRIEGEALWSMPPEAARLYFDFRKSDVAARSKLCDLGNPLGETTGALILLSAIMYLADRCAYNPDSFGWSKTVGIDGAVNE